MTEVELKRGDKQSIALKIMNGLSESHTFEEAIGLIMAQCDLDDPAARSMYRWLYKNRVENKDKGKVLVDYYFSASFTLPAPTTRKPRTEVPEEKKRGTKERLETIKAVAQKRNLKATTKKVEEMAKAGAHHFSSPDIIETPTTPEVAPAPTIEKNSETV